MAATYGLEVVAIWPLAAINVVCYVFQAPDAEGVAELLEAAVQDPRIITASQVMVFAPLNAVYSDDLVQQQHALEDLSAITAHAVSTGADIKVALIDSGAAIDHSDLSNQDVTFRDFIRPQSKDVIGEPHGTAMAALIAANAQNASGMVGVAPDVELLALRACWQDKGDVEICNSFSLARALNVAIRAEADIINMSLGGPKDPLIALLVEQALREDIVVVAGYGGNSGPLFPASHRGVLSASSTNLPVGKVLAPGQEVLSAKPGGNYDFFSGDSVASAHVTGVVALLLSLRQDQTARSNNAFVADLFDQIEGIGINACVLISLAFEASSC
ncbi:MAG: S8 family serine peptidase [Pseudomonadota bacterium]